MRKIWKWLVALLSSLLIVLYAAPLGCAFACTQVSSKIKGSPYLKTIAAVAAGWAFMFLVFNCLEGAIIWTSFIVVDIINGWRREVDAAKENFNVAPILVPTEFATEAF